MQQTSLSDSTLPSVIPAGISSYVVFYFNGVRLCKPISNAGPCFQADLCHMKAVKATTFNVDTCKMNESIENQIGGGGTIADLLDMFIDYKVLSAKALSTCKTLSYMACIMEDLNELLGSSCLLLCTC